jgi:D-alanyl-D-alanine carboxypeptidase (penicillin-binding protein 5/6)
VFISRRKISYSYKLLFACFGILAVLLARIGERMPPLPAATNYQESPYRLFNYINEYQTGPAVSAKAAILVDRTTGTILYAKAEHQRRAPASTTKIITAIVALERLSLEQKVEVSARASRVGGSSVYLRPGEVFTVEELLAGALLKSGNDATVALAEAAAGSVEEFAELMNQRAQNLGAQNSSFVNPHGLTAPNHYSTAFDLALFANYALGIPTFQEFVKKREGEMGALGGEWVRKLKNTNRLLWAFPGADGVKTGTTSRAGPCLVASATRGGRQLICVVLNSHRRWQDAVALLEYGFNDFKLVKLAKKGEPSGTAELADGRRVPLLAGGDLAVVVRADEVGKLQKSYDLKALEAPLAKHQHAGWLLAELEGVELGRTSLLVQEKVPRQFRFWKKIFPASRKK